MYPVKINGESAAAIAGKPRSYRDRATPPEAVTAGTDMYPVKISGESAAAIAGKPRAYRDRATPPIGRYRRNG